MAKLSPDDVLLGLLAVERAHDYQLLEHFRRPEQRGNGVGALALDLRIAELDALVPWFARCAATFSISTPESTP